MRVLFFNGMVHISLICYSNTSVSFIIVIYLLKTTTASMLKDYVVLTESEGPVLSSPSPHATHTGLAEVLPAVSKLDALRLVPRLPEKVSR